MQHLGKVTGKRVRWFPAESYAAQVEALRSGRLHIAGVATGPTPYAVNLAGFEPLVSMMRADGSIGYTLQVITHKDSPIKAIGVHEVKVSLHPEVSVTIKVNVARSPEEADLQAQGVDIMAQMFERDNAGFTEDYDPNAEPGATDEAAPEAAAEAPAEDGEAQQG